MHLNLSFLKKTYLEPIYFFLLYKYYFSVLLRIAGRLNYTYSQQPYLLVFVQAITEANEGLFTLILVIYIQ